MNLAICSLASGSSGNCYLVRSGETAILVDAGISAKQIRERIAHFGLTIADISAVLITHEHSDHIQGLKALGKKDRIRIFANPATLRGLHPEPENAEYCSFETGDRFAIGDISVSSFPVSHDAADPVGYYFEKDGNKISIVTDTGIVTDAVRRAMEGADILALESNHDESVLKMGRYPWFLKQRILGEKGHLSNDSAANALAEVLVREKTAGAVLRRTVLLAHLSRENNFPEMAIMTMENVLEASGIILHQEITVEALPRTEEGKLYFV